MRSCPASDLSKRGQAGTLPAHTSLRMKAMNENVWYDIYDRG